MGAQSATEWANNNNKKEIKPIEAPLQTSAGLFATAFAPTTACFTSIVAQIPQLLWTVGSRGIRCMHTL